MKAQLYYHTICLIINMVLIRVIRVLKCRFNFRYHFKVCILFKFFFNFIFYIYLHTLKEFDLFVLDLCCCTGSPLAVGSRGCSVVGKHGLLIVMASLLVKLRLEGKEGFSSCSTGSP